MPQVDPVILQLRADVAEYNKRVDGARRLTDQHLSDMEKRGQQMGQRISQSFNLASRAAIAFAAGFVTLNLAQNLLEIADEAKKLDAQLRLATNGFGSFGQAQKDVQRIAAETRSGLSETAALYGNFARGAKELGLSQSDAARATETFSKTLKISGASAAEAGSATLQFGQALAAGALRGDELNSILEASPRLARLLAESMGMPIGSIKQLGEQGALTSDKLLRALTDKKFTAGIDEEFRQMPVTFDEAMGQIENAAIVTFGAFDRGGQFSTALANFVLDGADGFDDMAKSAEDFGVRTRAAIEGLAGAFAPIWNEAKAFFAYLESATGSLSFDPARELGDIDKVTKWVSQQGLLGRLVTGNSAKGWWNGDPATGTNFRGRYIASRDAASRRLRGEAAERAVNDMLSPYFDRFGNPVKRTTSRTPSMTSGGGGRKGGGANSGAAAARKAESDRLKAIRDEASQARESARLDDEVLAAKAALATAAETVLQYQIQSIDSERNQRNADIETDVKLGQLSREEADRRILINSELSQYQKQLVRRRAEEAVAARDAAAARDEQDTLRAEAQLAETRQARRDIEMRILDLAYKEEEAAIRRAAANGEIADLDEALANLKRRQSAAVEGVQRQTESPFQRYMRDLRTEANNVGDAFEEAAVRGIDRINDGLAESATKALGFRGILGDILSDLIKIALRSQVLGSGGILGALGSLVGIGGKAVPGGSAAFNAAFADLSTMPRHASGTNFAPGGISLVGERGPELVNMPRGAQVIPNHLIGAAIGGTRSISQNITIKVDAQGALLAGQVQAMVAQGVQQATALGSQIGAGQAEARIMSRRRRTIPG